jgi:ABC-2 type transport system permease protein
MSNAPPTTAPAASPRLREQTTLAASAGRVWGMVLRYWYVIRSSWPRTAELIYWPLVQMLMWGFLQTYLAQTASFAAKAAGLFIGAVLLWDILVRSQLGFAVAFLEEIWSRNLGHLMMSPLRPAELVAALMAVSLIKLMVAMVPVAALAYFFFGFNVLSLGLAFGFFFANLIVTSWSLGLVSTGVVLRWGLGAESFAWLIVFVFLPLCCVYYPVATLPGWLQPVALALPPTYVFEGLRAIVLEGAFVGHLMLKAFALNIIYFLLGFTAFAYLLQSARIHGTLVQMGE